MIVGQPFQQITTAIQNATARFDVGRAFVHVTPLRQSLFSSNFPLRYVFRGVMLVRLKRQFARERFECFRLQVRLRILCRSLAVCQVAA